MSDIGFNDNLEIAGRTFHIQTASSTGKGSIRCEIFENGRVLSTSEVDFERRSISQKHSVGDRLKTVGNFLACVVKGKPHSPGNRADSASR